MSGEILKNTRLFQWNVGEKNLVTHLVRLSELESISIDDGDSFPSKDSAFLRMRLISGSLSLDITLLNGVKQVLSGENGTMFHASDSAFGNLFSSLSLFTNTHDKC